MLKIWIYGETVFFSRTIDLVLACYRICEQDCLETMLSPTLSVVHSHVQYNDMHSAGLPQAMIYSLYNSSHTTKYTSIIPFSFHLHLQAGGNHTDQCAIYIMCTNMNIGDKCIEIIELVQFHVLRYNVHKPGILYAVLTIPSLDLLSLLNPARQKKTTK